MNTKEAIKYYVYGFWHIYNDKPYVTKDDKIDVCEFDNIDDATKYLKKQVSSNINITWCLSNNNPILKDKGEHTRQQ